MHEEPSEGSYESVASEGGLELPNERGRDQVPRIISASHCVQVYRRLRCVDGARARISHANSKANSVVRACDPMAGLPARILRFDGAMEAWLEELPQPRDSARASFPYSALCDAATRHASKGIDLSILRTGNRRATIWYFTMEFLNQLWPFWLSPDGSGVHVWERALLERDCTIQTTHTKLGQVDCPAVKTLRERKQWLKALFTALQASKWSPDGEARKMLGERRCSHASMSIGDAIQIGGDLWVASVNGFVYIDEAGMLLPRSDTLDKEQLEEASEEEAAETSESEEDEESSEAASSASIPAPPPMPPPKQPDDMRSIFANPGGPRAAAAAAAMAAAAGAPPPPQAPPVPPVAVAAAANAAWGEAAPAGAAAASAADAGGKKGKNKNRKKQGKNHAAAEAAEAEATPAPPAAPTNGAAESHVAEGRKGNGKGGGKKGGKKGNEKKGGSGQNGVDHYPQQWHEEAAPPHGHKSGKGKGRGWGGGGDAAAGGEAEHGKGAKGKGRGGKKGKNAAAAAGGGHGYWGGEEWGSEWETGRGDWKHQHQHQQYQQYQHHQLHYRVKETHADDWWWAEQAANESGAKGDGKTRQDRRQFRAQLQVARRDRLQDY